MRNNYVFEKDDRCITLYKMTTVKDKESKNYGAQVKSFVGYYSSPTEVLKKLIHLELRESGTIKELLQDLKEVSNDVSLYVKGALK